MQSHDPRPPTPLSLRAGGEIFPGPFAAFFVTLAAIFATALLANLLGDMPFIAALGIGEALGLGGVATLAARRVPEPHAERIGLRGFSPRLLVPLLCLLPVVVLVSELDNWMRILLPPSPEVLELRGEIAELAKIDSTYAAVQTAIVAIGITPVVEGFLFFGVLLQGVISHLGRARGLLLCAVLYSLVHFPAAGAPGDAIVPVSASLIIGLLLGLVRLASGSILASILLAMAFATIQLVAMPLGETLPIAGFNAEGAHTPALILVPCGLCFLAGLYVLSQRAQNAVIHWPIPEIEDEDEGFHF